MGKNLRQLAVVARHGFTADGIAYSPPPRGLTLSETFWRRFGCYLGCGGCCPAHSLDYLPQEWEEFAERYPEHASDGEERALIVDGTAVTYVTSPQRRAQRAHGKDWCQYLDLASGACTVHRKNPYSCHVELVKLRVVKEKGWIGKMPFGRAWNMKRATDGDRAILCDFADHDHEQLITNDIPVLKRLDAWGRHLGVETKIPDVLDAIEHCKQEGTLGRVEIG